MLERIKSQDNRDKIKVLQFPIANSKGGITQYILQNWRFIDKSKFHFDFATMSKKLDFAEELEEAGSNIFYLSCYAEDNAEKFNEEFKKILVEGCYDIVHIHTKQWKSFNVEKIAKEIGVRKVIVHAHSTGIDTLDENKRQMEQALHCQVKEMLTEEVATDYWACSKQAADFLFGSKISIEKIKIMNNAIDLTKFKFNKRIRDEYRRELGIENYYVIGNVGRLAYQKNQEFLLEVFREIVQMRNDCMLILIGTGDNEKVCQQYVKQHGLMDRVRFLGYRKDIHCLLQAMDIFALPSKFEGLPIGAIEAQAAGLKCLCSDKVTDEVKITENIQMIPLEVELWKSAIIKLLERYERKDMTGQMTEAGYNIRFQIRNIEYSYSQDIE